MIRQIVWTEIARKNRIDIFAYWENQNWIIKASTNTKIK